MRKINEMVLYLKQMMTLGSYSTLLLLIFISCNKETKEEKYIRFLTNNNEKYWEVIENYPCIRYKGVYFKKDGTYESFIMNNKGRSLSKSYNSQKWRIVNDTLILGKNIKVLIEYISEYGVLLNAMRFKGQIFYKKSLDQKTKIIDSPTRPRLSVSGDEDLVQGE